MMVATLRAILASSAFSSSSTSRSASTLASASRRITTLPSHTRTRHHINPAPVSTLKPSHSRSYASFLGPAGVEQEPNALQATDPLLIYRAKVARGELEEDEEQLRALVQLRRINRVLRDYTPPAHLLGILNEDVQSQSSSALASAIDARLRPGAREFQVSPSSPSSGRGEGKIAELVKWLSQSEGLAELGTPKGLLVTGTPGTGKSMVMDIFYDSLPTLSKFRRHYHHLLLDVYKIIWEEAERRRISVSTSTAPSTATREIGTGAIWTRTPGSTGKTASAWRRALRGMPFFRPDSLADDQSENLSYVPGPDGDAVKTTLPLHAAAHLFLKHGHVLLFDEIQLVDVASAGLLRRTLEAYWRLGGVVVGTSNRIPKDLYASNVQRGQLTQFLEILQERCPNHEMRRRRDFRREPFYRKQWLERNSSEGEGEGEALPAQQVGGQTSYLLRSEASKFNHLVSEAVANRPFESATLTVYGRKLDVPRSVSASETHPSVCWFTFAELCDSPLGPADYLTLASTYHTFILEGVPQMTLMQKNQARRMITLLDAVYEAGCRLIVLADARPDDLFFPDAEKAARHAAQGPAAGPGDVRPELQYRAVGGGGRQDVVDMSAKGVPSPFLTPPPGQSYPEEEKLANRKAGQPVDYSTDEFMTDSLIMAETLSEAMQDTEEGFRPHVSTYSSDRPSRPAQLAAEGAAGKKDDNVGFKHLAIFSGEDERFSYQRAVSRLFEMSHPDWMRRKGWRPFLSDEMESWSGTWKQAEKEAVGKAVVADAAAIADAGTDFAGEASYETASFPGRREAQTKLAREMEAFAANELRKKQERGRSEHGQGKEGGKEGYQPDFSPGPIGKKRNRDQGAPVLSEAHVWGVREDWGKKAGAWGKGSAIFSEPECSSSSTCSPRGPSRASTAGPKSGDGSGKRCFHTTSFAHARVAALDHYSTLQVARSATQAEIKSQFYKLSKELHPDVNASDDAKKRFQEVSEAYATLGHPSQRKTYDRQSQSPSTRPSAYGDNVHTGFGYTHNAQDNINRRARATYAWDYQRRRKAQESYQYQTQPGGVGGGRGRQTHSSIFRQSKDGASAFETLAAQQRAREARNRARQTRSEVYSEEERMYEAHVANPLVRFAQVVVMLYLVWKGGTMFTASGPTGGKEARGKSQGR
ncbi:hypothetical protein NDA11_001272 [Ustilago hordei]|nr:hypothetical protein NDA10_003815 [Ustilago hordei]KAJ1592746.1 hypothetical protein NDA11_001272 [Ustilago hordei]